MFPNPTSALAVIRSMLVHPHFRPLVRAPAAHELTDDLFGAPAGCLHRCRLGKEPGGDHAPQLAIDSLAPNGPEALEEIAVAQYGLLKLPVVVHHHLPDAEAVEGRFV